MLNFSSVFSIDYDSKVLNVIFQVLLFSLLCLSLMGQGHFQQASEVRSRYVRIVAREFFEKNSV